MVLLETERLILRHFQRSDVHQLAPILANAEAMKFSRTGTLSTLQTQAKLDGFMAAYEKFGFGKWAVIFKNTDALIGYCGIAVELVDGVDERELGYRLAPEFWHLGLATEAALATVQHAFKQLRFPYVLGIVEPVNTASVRVLEKVGMKHERETIFYGAEMAVYRLDAVA
ncbi:MAG: GNAT family N-acetyltransferase [Cyanobacteria bacterium P01_C01_bin.70]